MKEDPEAEEMIDQIKNLRDAEFRELFQRLIREMDFHIKSSRRIGDQLLMEAQRTEGEEAHNYILSVKRGSVNPEDLQEFVHQKKDYEGMFFSTESFTEDALSYGRELNLELVDVGHFVDLLKRYSLLENVQRKVDASMLEREGARFLPSIGELENMMEAGVSALKRGDHKVALAYSERAISLKPNYDLAWTLKARTLEKMGEVEESLDAYKKALVCNIGDVELWLSLGMALFKLERHEEELEAYDQAIKINKNYTKAWLNKGATLHRLGRFLEAVECYDHVLKEDPDNADILNNKAVALKALGDNERALTFYERAVEADPNFVDARMNKALLLQDLGKYRDAAKELEVIVKQKPADPKIWFFKGSVHYDLKQKKQAVLAFEKVLELDSRFKNAKKMLNRSKRLKKKKKISKDDYPCFGEYEEGEEGCEECGVQDECKEKAEE